MTAAHRLVAAELERRWEAALVALKQAEDALVLEQQAAPKPTSLPEELKTALTAIGEKLPLLGSYVGKLIPAPALDRVETWQQHGLKLRAEFLG